MSTKKIEINYFVAVPLVLSVFTTLFLFYIDEGFYNFKWMLSVGNWLIFMVYVAILFSVQWLFVKMIFYKINNSFLMALKYILGIALGLMIAFWILK